MSTFAFRAVDLAGVPSRGELEAGSKAQVTEQLRQRGLIVLDVSEKREALKLESVFQRFKSVNLRNLSVFSRQFATLITSGMPMLRSLYTLEEQTEDEMLKKAIVGVRQDVEAGSSVAAAMESQPGVFDPLYRSMVYAGEGSGRLEEALDRVAFQLEKLDALRRQVKSALMYPAVVFGLAIVVMVVVVAFIVPVFVGIFEEIAAENPGAEPSCRFMTQITVGISDFITGKWYILLPAIGIATYALPALEEDRARAAAVGQGQAADPVPHRRRRPEGRAGALVADLLGHGLLRRADPAGDPDLRRDRRQRRDRGGDGRRLRLGQARRHDLAPLAEHRVFPPMVSHMVSVGEDSGQLETMLEKIADFYDAEVDAKVKALTSLIEPVMIMFVGGIVGFIVISMYLPIFSLYDNIR